MRATPTLDCTSGTNFYRLYRGNTLDYVDDFTLTQATRKAFRAANTTDASGTAGTIGGFYNPSTETDLKIIAFNAELLTMAYPTDPIYKLVKDDMTGEVNCVKNSIRHN